MNAIRRALSGNLSGSSKSPESKFVKKTKLECCLDDFEPGVTLGTGTFGRVRLAKFLKANEHTDKFYALKALKKSEILRQKQLAHIKSEVSLLSKLDHPFIVNMINHFQDDHKVYMVLEYIPGGELFSYLRSVERMPHDTVKLYSAQIVLAFEYLHNLDVIYRDLKPENLLITREGNMKITDFGFAKLCPDRTFTLCGTPEYLAPEIIQSKGHGKGVDWWAMGILIYEMLAGYPPFHDDSPFGIYQKILGGRVHYGSYFKKSSKNLISRLLVSDRTNRLGCLKGKVNDVKNHEFYADMDWAACVRLQIPTPYQPTVKDEGDASNFDKYPESTDRFPVKLQAKDAALFAEFEKLGWDVV